MSVQDVKQWVGDHPGTTWEPGDPRPRATGARRRAPVVGEVSAAARRVVVGCYRLTGVWPETARLLWPGGLPESLRVEGETARAKATTPDKNGKTPLDREAES